MRKAFILTAIYVLQKSYNQMQLQCLLEGAHFLKFHEDISILHDYQWSWKFEHT
jgi:hypothetical protein